MLSFFSYTLIKFLVVNSRNKNNKKKPRDDLMFLSTPAFPMEKYIYILE